MILVRELAESDLPALVELARAMHGESPVYSRFAYEGDKVEAWGRLCLASPDWICLIAVSDELPVGFIAAGCVDMLFSSQKTVDDIGFYVVPACRGSRAAMLLVRHMEMWAKAKEGCIIRVGITTGTNNEAASRFMGRMGYEQTGLLMEKSI